MPTGVLPAAPPAPVASELPEQEPESANLTEVPSPMVGTFYRAASPVRRSDHWPFLQVGVPATFFHTGLHPDYHQFTDTPDRINYPKMEMIARLVYLTSWSLANDDGRPALDRDL